MSKLRHTLQLLHGGALSTRQIGAALGISKSTVSEIASYARVAGVDWALAQSLNDDELQALFDSVAGEYSASDHAGDDERGVVQRDTGGRRGQAGHGVEQRDEVVHQFVLRSERDKQRSSAGRNRRSSAPQKRMIRPWMNMIISRVMLGLANDRSVPP